MAKSTSRSSSEPIFVYGVTDGNVVPIDLIAPENMPQTEAGVDLLSQFEKARNSVDGVIFSQGKTNLGSDMSEG